MRTLKRPIAFVVGTALLGVMNSAAAAQSEDVAPADGFASDVMFEITLPAAAMPARLGRVNMEIHTIEPGVDAEVGIGNEAARGKALYIESGELLIEPMVDALHWAPGTTLDGSASTVAAGEAVRLIPGSLILLPAIEPDQLLEGAVIRVSNPGDEPVIAPGFHLHSLDGSFPGWPSGIDGVWVGGGDGPGELEQLSVGDVAFRLSRLSAGPGASMTVPDDALFSIYRVETGRVGMTSRGPGGETTLAWGPGSGGATLLTDALDWELAVTPDGPATLLELAAIPLGEPVGIDAASSEATE